MRTSLKSPAVRTGGKYFLCNWLMQYVPAHITYVEPFCGAGHLLFAKTPSKVEILNDIDGYLIAFFQVIKDSEKRQKLIKELGYTPYSRMIWQMIRQNWKHGDVPDDEIERAAQWFFLNRSCFGGDQERGGFAIPSITGRNPCTSFRNTIETFEEVADRLRNVVIENLGFEECVKRYDSPETFFYCDPPYMDTEHYYTGYFTQESHDKLSELLHSIEGKAMVSHYQNDSYDDLYKGWNRYDYSSFKGSHKAEAGAEKPKTIETLYCNFQTQKTRGLSDD